MTNSISSALNAYQQALVRIGSQIPAEETAKADIQDVVLAVSNAEMALETVVAVRDTAIKAYKEIMQMTV